MGKITKPMLAGTLTDISKLKYPILCTPKLDGIRCLVVGGKAVSRTFKPIPNNHIRTMIESTCVDGMDGEIICEGKTFSETTGNVMREDGESEFVYNVFDFVKDKTTTPYNMRIVDLMMLAQDGFEALLPVEIENEAELLKYETKCLEGGYEGVMIRAPTGPYKEGRSTEREGWLLKLKRFQDSEAIVLAIEEKMNNENIAEKDAFGRSKRSTAQDGLVKAGTMGALKVRDIKTNIEFSIGSGFNDEFRNEVWKNKNKYIGKIVTYKHQESGMKTAPRFPVYKSIRHPDDISE